MLRSSATGLRAQLAFAVIALLVPLESGAQTSRAIDGHRVPLGTDTVRMELLRGRSREPIRTAVTIVQRREVTPGDTVLEHISHWLAPGGTIERADTFGVALATMLPRYYRSRSAKNADSVEWTSLRVHGQISGVDGPGSVEPVDQTLTAPSYGFEALGILVRAAPLAKGYKAKLAMFDPRFGVGPLELKVRGEEQLAGGRAWKVETEYAHIPQTFYVDQATGRIALHQFHIGRGVTLESTATWALAGAQGR